MPSHYNRIRVPPRIEPLQQIGGLINEISVYGDQARNTAKRRQEAADIIAGNRNKAAKASADFNRPTNRPNVGKGRVKGTKFYTGRGQKHAQTISQFHDAAKGISMVAGAQRNAWNRLAADPRTRRLSNNQQRGYVAAFAGPSLGHENMRQRLQRTRDQAKYARLLGDEPGLFGKGTVRRSRQGLGRRRSRI